MEASWEEEEKEDPTSAIVICFPFFLLFRAPSQDELMGKPAF